MTNEQDPNYGEHPPLSEEEAQAIRERLAARLKAVKPVRRCGNKYNWLEGEEWDEQTENET